MKFLWEQDMFKSSDEFENGWSRWGGWPEDLRSHFGQYGIRRCGKRMVHV